MGKRFIAAFLILLSICASARAEEFTSIAGLWQTDDLGRAWILAIDRGGVFEAIVVKNFRTVVRAQKLPYEEGDKVFSNMKLRDPTTYDGTLVNPADGKSYPGVVFSSGDYLVAKAQDAKAGLPSLGIWKRL